MNIRECRVKFTYLFSMKLIPKAIELGFEPAFDEITNHQGTGHMKNSLHYLGCAGDLLLYKDTHYCPFEEYYVELGHYWQSLDPNCAWGGEWGDGNHFSYAPIEVFGGRK